MSNMHSDETKKMTWKQIKNLIESAGVSEDDEIDCIEISWGTPEQIKLTKDKDFGWQIRQNC